MKKRIISLLLAMVMIFGVLPVTALADGEQVDETGETVVEAVEENKEEVPAPDDDSEEEESNIEEENKEDISNEEVDELSLLAAEPVAYASDKENVSDGTRLIFRRFIDNVERVISVSTSGSWVSLQDVPKNTVTDKDYTFTLKSAGTITIGGASYNTYHVSITVNGKTYYITSNLNLSESNPGTFLIKTASVSCKGGVYHPGGHANRLCLFCLGTGNKWQAVEYEENGNGLTLCAHKNSTNNANWGVCCDAYDLEEAAALIKDYTVTITKEYSGTDDNIAEDLVIKLTSTEDATKEYEFTKDKITGKFSCDKTLPAGTYNISETGTDIDGYTWNETPVPSEITIPSPSASESEVSTQSLLDLIISGGGHHGGFPPVDPGEGGSGSGSTTEPTEPTVPDTNTFEFTVTNTYTKNHIPTATSVEKQVVCNEDEKGLPAAIDRNGITFPNKEGTTIQPIVITKDTQSVTLLYKITVKGDANAEFEVTDADTTLVYPTTITQTGDKYTGTLPEVVAPATEATLDFYVKKTFQSTDFSADSGKLTNEVSLDGGTGDKEEVPYEKEITVTITGNTDTKVYNGSEQSVTGYTTDVNGKDINVDLKAGKEAKASGTNVDKYEMGLTADDFTVTSDVYSNIKVVVVDGWLEITPVTDEITVTITGNTATKVYTGSEQSVTGYTTDVGDKPITVTMKEGRKAEAKGTNVNTYQMGLTKDDFTVTSNTYSNIKVVVVDGWLKITPVTDEVTVTITGNSAEKVYTGSEQSVTGYTTDVGDKTINVAPKEGKEAKATGINAGEYPMGLTKADFDVTSDNYSNINVVVVDGKLTITRITDEVTVKVIGNTATKDYNGKEQSVEGFTFEDYGKGITVTLKEGKEAKATGKPEGTYWMSLKAEDFTATSKNYSNIKIEVEDGWLKIVNNSVSVNFSELIQKQLTITGDNTFTGATFYATLNYYTPLIQSVIDPDRVADYNLKATFVKGDKSGTIRKFVDKTTGENLTIDFPAADTYSFRLEELEKVTSDHSDVKYDSSVYFIDVVVVEDEDTGALSLGSIQCEKLVSNKLVTVRSPITFKNEIDTGKKGSHIKIDSPNKLNTDDHFAYIIGYPDGTVQPNGEITRAEVATIFFRLLKDDVRDKYFTKTNDFSDVDRNDWFNNPVSTMAELGIVKGYPDGTFRPNEPITRAEFAAIAARFDESTRYGETRFTDVSGHWAIREIAKAYNNGWIKGYPDNTFRPNRNITRAEAMTLINRVLNRAPETENDLLSSMNKWSDNMDVDAWYYLAVQEATNSHDYRRKTSSYEHWLRMLEDPNWAKYER